MAPLPDPSARRASGPSTPGRAGSVLAVVPRMLRPDHASGDLRFCRMLTLMAETCEVDLGILGGDPTDGPVRTSLEAAGVRFLTAGGEAVLDALASRPYAMVVCEFWWTAELLLPQVRWAQPGAGFVVDSVDIHFAREEAGIPLGHFKPAEVAARKGRELAVYRSADAVVVVTGEDAGLLNDAGGMPRLVVVPNVVEGVSRAPITRDPELLFIGGFDHHPNVDAVRWFADEVFPSVRREEPDARWLIVGSNPTAEVRALASRPGIEVVGFVPETRPYLERAAVSVAPLRYGGGMKGKVTEAMAAGLPVVTTAFGAQGLQAVDGTHLLVADSPADFAAAVVGLLQDPGRAEAIGSAAQRHIADLCGPEAVRVRIGELVGGFPAVDCGPLRRLRMRLFGAYLSIRRLVARIRYGSG